MKNSNEKGFALVLSLVLMLAMSLMGGALIVISAGDHSANNQSDDYQQTFYVAETALLEGERHILNIYLGPYKTDGTRDMTKRTLPINQTAVFNGSMTLGNYADKKPFFIQYKTGAPEEYKMVLNGTICFNSFPDIYKNDFKIIEDKLKNPGAISNNYGELLSLALSSKGSTEEKNEAEKLKFYYYEYFISRIGAAPFRGTGSSIKKTATDVGNDGMAYRIYGCGIRNGEDIDPMVVPLESVIVLPK